MQHVQHTATFKFAKLEFGKSKLLTMAAALACAALMSALVRPAEAQDLGTRPIRMIVGVVAGGATDVTSKTSRAPSTNRPIANSPAPRPDGPQPYS